MLQLIKHQWKETRRSPAFQKSIAINIIMGLMILYFMLIFIGIGAGAHKIIAEFYPDADPIDVFNGYLLLYFMASLASRFFLQDLPTMTLQPYLHLPIKRGRIVHHMLIRSIFSFFNFSPLLMFVPFAIINIIPAYGIGVAIIWLVTIFFIILANNFLVVYLKRMMAKNFGLVAGFGVLVMALGALDYFDIINISTASTALFGFVLAQPISVLIFIAIFAGLYFINYQYLKANTYMEEISIHKEKKADGFTNISLLDKFGDIGKLITLEIKMIVRHKRPSTLLKMTPLFLLYGLIFYPQDIYVNNYYWLMFVGLFVTGAFFMNYGQYLYSWESEYFDAMIAHNIDTKKYIQSKFFLMVPVVAVCYLLTLPYAFFGTHIVIVNTIMFVWNIGVSSFILLYFSTNNSKRLELSQKAAFNWQGVGVQQFIMVIPLLVLPMLIYFPFSYFLDMPNVGLAVIGVIGLVNLLLYDFWIDKVVERFNAQKYKMAAGFRKKEG